MQLVFEAHKWNQYPVSYPLREGVIKRPVNDVVIFSRFQRAFPIGARRIHFAFFGGLLAVGGVGLLRANAAIVRAAASTGTQPVFMTKW